MSKTAVVVGGGFGGLSAARALAKSEAVRVVLIDQRNHHLFQPLLYQVATAGLNPADIAVPIRSQFTGNDNVAVHLGRVTAVDLPGKTVGVELAGAIADISRTVLVRDFRRIDPASARVILLEAGPRLLPAFAEDLSRRAQSDLSELGVEVRTGAMVTGVDEAGVEVGAERIEARSVFWAAG